MTKHILYRYADNGGSVVSTVKPNDREYTELYRIIADEGNVIVHGEITAKVIDTETPDDWHEEPEKVIEHVPTPIEEPIVEIEEIPEELIEECEPPAPPKPAPIHADQAIMQIIVEHEYRLSLMEMGVN